MNANDFAAAWRRERDELLLIFTDPASKSEAARLFGELQLNPDQRAKLITALGAALDDTLYTLLMGLDGAADIGGVQEQFHLTTSDGTLVYKSGELEVAAYEHFHA